VEERNKFKQNLKVMKKDCDNKNLADKKMEKSETEEEREDEEVEERNMTDWEKKQVEKLKKEEY
jgi:hypothetical protein